ncbi:hypothetical protein D3C80_1668990 [compost metagenome]
MRNLDTLLIFAQFDQALGGVDGFLPVAGQLIDLQELLQSADAEFRFIDQLAKHIFSTIIKTRSHIVAA